jgi:hypothetical protein
MGKRSERFATFCLIINNESTNFALLGGNGNTLKLKLTAKLNDKIIKITTVRDQNYVCHLPDPLVSRYRLPLSPTNVCTSRRNAYARQFLKGFVSYSYTLNCPHAFNSDCLFFNYRHRNSSASTGHMNLYVQYMYKVWLTWLYLYTELASIMYFSK